jgi:phosphoribosylanthranilate isomerase
VDIIGLVVEYPVSVPWNMERERAKELIDHFREYTLTEDVSSKICIVTGGDAEKITELGRYLIPDYIQMHYKETAEDIRKVSEALRDIGVEIIKTIPNDTAEMKRQSGEDSAGKCGRTFQEAGAKILLVDARGPENAAGSSSLLDAELYHRVRQVADIPVMAAGGITGENISEILDMICPDMIDIMTGVEESYGIKSYEKLVGIMNKIR